MSQNQFLALQVDVALTKDALTRVKSGIVDIRFHGVIDNGYFTGYEMLHGSHAGLGDVRLLGFATVNPGGGISYNVTATWNDRIDPNPIYFGDRLSSGVLKAFGNPKDFNVHISWPVTRSF